MTMLNRIRKFFRKLRNKDFREAFVSARVAAAVGAQIAALRQKNRWSQEELAQRANMKQPRIALLEKGDYESFSFATLKRLASAFGVAVRIDFLSFPDFLKWSEGFTSTVLVPDSFDESTKALEFEETVSALGWEEPALDEQAMRHELIVPLFLVSKTQPETSHGPVFKGFPEGADHEGYGSSASAGDPIHGYFGFPDDDILTGRSKGNQGAVRLHARADDARGTQLSNDWGSV
jgi:transcriptional regulator with XRE-family HTH domain